MRLRQGSLTDGPDLSHAWRVSRASMEKLVSMNAEPGPDEADASAGPTRGPRDEQWLDIARAVIAELFGAPSERSFDVQYWNGEVEPGMAPSLDGFGLVLN